MRNLHEFTFVLVPSCTIAFAVCCVIAGLQPGRSLKIFADLCKHLFKKYWDA